MTEFRSRLKEFAEFILLETRELMEKHNMTYAEVEAQSGVSICTISRVIFGGKTPSLKILIQLEEWLHSRSFIEDSIHEQRCIS